MKKTFFERNNKFHIFELTANKNCCFEKSNAMIPQRQKLDAACNSEVVNVRKYPKIFFGYLTSCFMLSYMCSEIMNHLY